MQNAAGFGVVELLYLIAASLFIVGLKGLTRIRSARRGNFLSGIAMLIAVVATILEIGYTDYRWIAGGLLIGAVLGVLAAARVKMTEMPEMVALLNGFGGAASALVAVSTIYLIMVEGALERTVSNQMGGASALTVVLSILIGGVTFSGSLMAFLKLRGRIRGEPILVPGRHLIHGILLAFAVVIGWYAAYSTPNPVQIAVFCWTILAVALVLGVMLVIPIGGADMPVVISLLNSYSGLAAAATGFVINNAMLIVAGSLVGASGIILTRIMCRAMNRSLPSVVLGGFGAVSEAAGPAGSEYSTVRSAGAEEAAMLLQSADRVMVVPGYGLAVAQAQYAVKEIADILGKRGTRVAYAIHPVAGRMPGHMNVLLAEADVPYEALLEMDAANAEFKNTDVALIVGANDVVNPAAEKDPSSPIAGMPILQAYNARSVIVIKRSLSPGFAGIKNELFEHENTVMVFMDAKAALQEILAELKTAA